MYLNLDRLKPYRIMQNIKLLLVVLIVPFLGVSQNIDETILKIRKEFQRINSNTTLKKIDLYNEEFMEYIPDGGGQITGCFENDDLVKITEWMGPSYGVIITEYYLKDGDIFFAYQKENKFKDVFDASGDWMHFDTSKLEIKFEGRYYFENRKLIKELNKGNPLFDRTFKETEFLEQANIYAEILKKSRLKKNKKN